MGSKRRASAIGGGLAAALLVACASAPSSGTRATARAVVAVAPAFSDSFDAPEPTTGNRNGALSTADYSVARWRSELSDSGNQKISAGPDLPGDVAISNGRVVLQTGSMAYGDTMFRVNQPFDIAGRTGVVKFDASLWTPAFLQGFTTFGFFADPYSVPEYDDDNSRGALADQGFSAYWEFNCGEPIIRTYASHVETDDLSADTRGDCTGRPTTSQGRLNRIEVRVSQTHLEIWASDASADGVTFGPLKRIYAGDPHLNFARGYLYFGGHNHFTLKYGGPPTWTTYWDNLSFDGPVVSPTKVSQVPNSGPVSFGWPLRYAPSWSTPLTLPSAATGTAARLLLNVGADFLHNPNGAAWRLNYRLNGGASHSVGFGPPLPTPNRAGSFTFSIPVAMNELHAGDNVVEFSGTGMEIGWQAYFANVDLVVTPDGVVPPTTTTSPTTSTTSSLPASSTTTTSPSTSTSTTTTTTASSTTSTTAPASSPCTIQKASAPVAFCETFDAAHPSPGTRSGDLDATLWGVSRQGNMNPPPISNTIYPATVEGCASSGAALPPQTVRVCGGRLLEAVNDHDGVISQAEYPKQPFDIAGRTGTVAFDVSDDSDGVHGSWPEFWWTDQPLPAPGDDFPLHSPIPRNGVGVSLAASGGFAGGQNCLGDQAHPITYGVHVDQISVIRNYVLQQMPFVEDGCLKKGTATGPLNHFEIRMSANRIEVWGSDAGSSVLRLVAHLDNANIQQTRGVIWLEDVHYNASKAGCCGGIDHAQTVHTYAWDNVAFDGPKPYRDLTFDVPDNTAPSDGGMNTGYPVNSLTSPTLTVQGVHWSQTPTSALVMFTWFDRGGHTVPSVSVNGNAPISTVWPFDNLDAITLRTIAVPVPLSQIVAGANTLRFTSGDNSAVANVDIALIAAAPVP